MVKQRVKFTFLENLIKEPTIYQLGELSIVPAVAGGGRGSRRSLRLSF